MNLFNLYEHSEGMLEYLELSSSMTSRDITKWNRVITNHIESNIQLSNALKMPSIPNDLIWVNITSELSHENDLAGRLLVLDFFTTCCVNCDQILPILKEVEEDYVDDSTVLIGIHSPKFPNEKNIDTVRAAVTRNNITHLVLHDPSLYLWNNLNIFCWPTVLIIAPNGNILFSIVGESQIDKLKHIVCVTKQFFTSSTLPLNVTPLTVTFNVELAAQISEELFHYPNCVTFYKKQIIVSDTGNHRLILANRFGLMLEAIGNGNSGSNDGSFVDATFNNPRGTAWYSSDVLFVADTGNHSIRAIDLKYRKVSTIYDGKKKKHSRNFSCDKICKQQFLSPWDVCFGPKIESDDMSRIEVLYVAVAGSHQIWALYFSEFESCDWYKYPDVTHFAGNGKEECRNNVYRLFAGFAQPSAITYSLSQPGMLFIADSESSSIRSISLKNGHVQTVVGGPLNPLDLFQIGDIDGKKSEVKLQHPLGICVSENGDIIISDTYNHKIKSINLEEKECKTLILKLDKSEHPRDVCFKEPSGMCYIEEGDSILVADTNNHCIQHIDLKSKIIKKMAFTYINYINEVDNLMHATGRTEDLDNSHTNVANLKLSPYSHTEIHSPDINLKKGGKICFFFKIVNEAITLTGKAPTSFSVTFKGKCDWEIVSGGGEIFDPVREPSLVFNCKNEQVPKNSTITLKLDFTVCDQIKKACISSVGTVVVNVLVTDTAEFENFHLNIVI